jgi:hypothetical protein
VTQTQTPNLGQQIYDEQQRLQAAVTARQERLNQERREQEEIKASQQRIADLQRQQAQQQFDDALQQNAQAVEANNGAVEALFKVLNGMQQALSAGGPEIASLEASFEQQQRIHDRALNAANGLVIPTEVTDTTTLDTAARADARKIGGYEGRITPALNRTVAIYKWVTQARGEDEIRARIGIGFALTGIQMGGWDTKNPPTDESIRNQLKGQLTRIRLY